MLLFMLFIFSHLFINGLWHINIISEFIYPYIPSLYINLHHIFSLLLLIYVYYSLYFYLLKVLLFENILAIFNCSSNVTRYSVTRVWLGIGCLPSTAEVTTFSEFVSHLNLMYHSCNNILHDAGHDTWNVQALHSVVAKGVKTTHW